MWPRDWRGELVEVTGLRRAQGFLLRRRLDRDGGGAEDGLPGADAARRDETRTTFVSLASGYHGDTVGAMSAGHSAIFHAAYKPLLFETREVMSPACYRCPHQSRGAGARHAMRARRANATGNACGELDDRAGRAGRNGLGVRDRTARAGRGGHDDASARLSGKGGDGVPRARRLAGARRSDDRLWAHGRDVRLSARGRRRPIWSRWRRD